jgi:hypothetical protein
MQVKTKIIVTIVGVGFLGAMMASGASPSQTGFDADIARHAFGSEAFWGDALQLHKAIAGEKKGGVGPGVSPKTALSVGLKIDADALPRALKKQLAAGKVDLDDPATTIALLKLNAVVGVTAFANPTVASSRWASSARFAIRLSTTHSRLASASGSTVGPTAI